MKKLLIILSMTALLALQANAETLTGDLNGDNEINITDVNLLIHAISTGDSDALYDLNGDGSINITDLSVLLEIAMAVTPEPDFDIDSEHATGWWVVFSKIDGEKVWYQLHEDYIGIIGCTNPHITHVTLNYGDYGSWYWDPEMPAEWNEANRPFVPFCFVIDGVRYGASISMAKANVTKNNKNWEGGYHGHTRNPLIKSNKYYSLPVGYAFTIWIDIDEETGDYYVNTAFGPYA